MLPPQVLNLFLFATAWPIYRKCLKTQVPSLELHYKNKYAYTGINPFSSIPCHTLPVRKIGKSDYRRHEVPEISQGIKGLEPSQLTFTCSKFKVNNRNNRKRCEMCQWRRPDVFIVNFEHISHLFLMFLLLNLNK